MGQQASNPFGQVQGEGRSGSLDYLVRRYSRALASFFQRRVSNQDEVPDLVQDVFLRLSRLQELPELRHPEAYLFQTASCALRDRVRRTPVASRVLPHRVQRRRKSFGSGIARERRTELFQCHVTLSGRSF